MTDTPPPPAAPEGSSTGGAPPTPPVSHPEQPAYAHPAYTAPAYGAGYVAAPRTNPLAIVSLVASCVGAVFFWFLAPIAGAIMGHIAMGQIKRTGENGRGLALAGILVGWISLGIQILILAAYIIFVVVLFANHPGSTTY